jgi:Tol biopolymer transport system component
VQGDNRISAGNIGLHQPIPDPENRAVLAELEKLLADGRFAGSPSLIRFLRHTVSETLAGRTSELREGPLGLSVFDRGRDFDPRMDPIVRVQARKVRARLQDYYEHQGAADPIRIELPRASYVPRFILSRPPTVLTLVSDSPRGSTTLASTATSPKRRTGVLWIGALAGAILIALLGWKWWSARSSPAPALELTRLTYEAGSTMSPALSRDGKLLAYSSDRGKENLNIWIQPVRGGARSQLTRQESPALNPDFSPDGLRVVFRTRRGGGGIVTVSVFGGEERRIAGVGWLPRYSPDGKWIAYQGNGALFVVPSAGGQSREVGSGNIELRDGPLWSPDGKHLLALGSPRGSHPPTSDLDWYAVPWTGGKPVSLGFRKQLIGQRLADLSDLGGPSDWLGDNIVFTVRLGDGLNVWKVPVNPRRLHVTGPVVQLTSGPSFESPRCSAAGQIVFYNEIRMTHVYGLRVDKSGRARGAPEQLTEDSSLTPERTWPRLSADGARLTYVSGRSGTQEVMLKDLVSGKEAIALTPARQDLPLIAADSSALVYESREPNQQIFQIPAAGQPSSQNTGERCGAVEDWSDDGRMVLMEAPSHAALIAWDRDANRRVEWLTYRPGTLLRATLSQDRKWVALVFSDPYGGFVARLDAAGMSMGQLIRVVDAPDLASLHWSQDGGLLYYISSADDHNCLWAQRLDPATKRPSGSPFAVLHLHSNRLAPWRDWISAGRDRLVFPLTELRSDIWMATTAAWKDVTASDLR